MRQTTLAVAGFDRYAKTTRRVTFLAEMEAVVPWAEFCSLIEPFYPKAGNGRRPVGLERMLRIYFLQQWFDLSDPGAEESLYDSHAMRRFVGIDLGREPEPDETKMGSSRRCSPRGAIRPAKANSCCNIAPICGEATYYPRKRCPSCWSARMENRVSAGVVALTSTQIGLTVRLRMICAVSTGAAWSPRALYSGFIQRVTETV